MFYWSSFCVKVRSFDFEQRDTGHDFEVRGNSAVSYRRLYNLTSLPNPHFALSFQYSEEGISSFIFNPNLSCWINSCFPTFYSHAPVHLPAREYRRK